MLENENVRSGVAKFILHSIKCTGGKQQESFFFQESVDKEERSIFIFEDFNKSDTSVSKAVIVIVCIACSNLRLSRTCSYDSKICRRCYAFPYKCRQPTTCFIA